MIYVTVRVWLIILMPILTLISGLEAILIIMMILFLMKLLMTLNTATTKKIIVTSDEDKNIDNE